jgi:hypothetical protein
MENEIAEIEGVVISMVMYVICLSILDITQNISNVKQTITTNI